MSAQVTHTAACHDACDGRLRIPPTDPFYGVEIGCRCSCHHPLEA